MASPFKEGDLVTWADPDDSVKPIDALSKYSELNGPGPFLVKGDSEYNWSVKLEEPLEAGEHGHEVYDWDSAWFKRWEPIPLTLDSLIELLVSPLE